MTQFVSALELATYANGTTELGDLSAEWIAQANLLLELISADVEAAAGVPIDAGTRTLLLPGTWSRDLDLPPNVRDVTAVAVNGTTIPADGWSWNGRQTLRLGATFTADEAEAAEDDDDELGGAEERSGLGWGGPESTVAVEVAEGFETVPTIVRSLVFRVAARTIGNISQLTQETLGIYSASFGPASSSGSHVTDAERRRLRLALARRTAGTIGARGR